MSRLNVLLTQYFSSMFPPTNRKEPIGLETIWLQKPLKSDRFLAACRTLE